MRSPLMVELWPQRVNILGANAQGVNIEGVNAKGSICKGDIQGTYPRREIQGENCHPVCASLGVISLTHSTQERRCKQRAIIPRGNSYARNKKKPAGERCHWSP
jgi:hypothetical protein